MLMNRIYIEKKEQGLLTIPIIDGKPMEEGDYVNLESAKRKQLEEKLILCRKSLWKP